MLRRLLLAGALGATAALAGCVGHAGWGERSYPGPDPGGWGAWGAMMGMWAAMMALAALLVVAVAAALLALLLAGHGGAGARVAGAFVLMGGVFVAWASLLSWGPFGLLLGLLLTALGVVALVAGPRPARV